jgi:CubicO group peptidase (beta-lactamase class C family)
MLTMSSGLEPYDGPYWDAEAYAKLTGRRRPAHAAETGAHRLFAVAQRLLGWQAGACRAALGKAVPPDTFHMSGFGMQACWIIPSLDMIVVRLASSRALNSRIDFYSEFLARLMEAVR